MNKTMIAVLLTLGLALPQTSWSKQRVPKSKVAYDNGFQAIPQSGKGRVAPAGVIVGKPSGLCLRDLNKEHKRELARLKKEHGLHNVTIVAAPDDYWYYSLETGDRLYGVANQQGQVVIPPVYASCHYCPVVSQGVEEFVVSDRSMEQLALFHLWHPQTDGAFLTEKDFTCRVFSVSGEEKAAFVGPATYYHGYLFGNVQPSDIGFTDIYGWPSLLVSNEKNGASVSLYTSSGHALTPDLKQYGLQIDDWQEGAQAVFDYQYDEAGVLRKGGFLMNQPSNTVPAIFGEVFYDAEMDTWFVKPNAMQNLQIYDPAQHTAVNYADEGERLFYQERYDDCIKFYGNIVSSGEPQTDLARACFYTGLSYAKQVEEHMDEYVPATTAFENIGTGAYSRYYDQRFERLAWPASDIPHMTDGASLLQRSQSYPDGKQYSNAAEVYGKWLTDNQPTYELFQNRYNNALASLDTRIAEMKEAQRRQAEEEAARQAEVASQISGIIANSLNNISAGLSQRSSRSTVSTLRTTPTYSGKYGSNRNSAGKVYGGGTTTVATTSNDSGHSSLDTNANQKTRKTCSRCNGSGKMVEERTIHSGSGLKVVNETCSECGKTYDKTEMSHKHVTCSGCKGKGYWEFD